MMIWHKQNISIFLFVCTIFVVGTESRYRDKDSRRRGDKSNRMYDIATLQASTTATQDLCSRERDKKLLCYCLPDPTTNSAGIQGYGGIMSGSSSIGSSLGGGVSSISNTNSNNFKVLATKADCWIFHRDFHQNDSIWQAFYHQKSLKDLKFTVQPTGYLDYIPTKYLEILHNLTHLSIEYAQILVVKGYAFGNLPNLEIITLSNNQIEILDQNAFSNHILLKELNLMGNQITEIDRYAFKNLPQLSVILLNQNNLSNLHDETFSELSKLEELDLSSNQISVVTGDMFKGLGNLKVLKISKNTLNFVGDTVFAELWSLQELDLDDNKIERISERALDGLNNLRSLNLRNNRLKKLDNGLLRGTPALLSINLQYNLLETLTYYNFQPIMDNLVNNTSELSVSDNKFICDCRLQWLFELRNRTKNNNLKTILEEIECFLYTDSKKYHAAISSSQQSDEILMNAIKDELNDPNIENFGQSNLHHLHQQQQQQQQHEQQEQQKLQQHHFKTQHANSHHHSSLSMRQQQYPMGHTNNKGDFDTEYYEDQALSIYHHNIQGGDNVGGGSGGESGVVREYHNFDDSINRMVDGDILISHKTRSTSNNNNNKKNFKRKSGGQLVELFQLKPESLPCPEELSDPTELPLSRESIGFINIRGSNSIRHLPHEVSTQFLIISIITYLTQNIFSLSYNLSS